MVKKEEYRMVYRHYRLKEEDREVFSLKITHSDPLAKDYGTYWTDEDSEEDIQRYVYQLFKAVTGRGTIES